MSKRSNRVEAKHIVEVPNAHDPWLNNLSILLAVFSNMEEREIRPTLDYLNSRFG